MSFPAPPIISLPHDTGRCAECGHLHPMANLVPLSNFPICASCKPEVIRKISTGLPVGRLWRKGRVLFANRDAAFPSRCVKCNCEVSNERLRRKLTWHPPLVYILLLLSPIIYLLFALCTQKKAELFVPLCDNHRRNRRGAILTAWGIFATSIGAFVMAAGFSNGWLVLGGVVLLITSMIWGTVGARVIVARRITREHVQISGVCNEFLDELPQWAG
jgi:hypothetical protein